MFHIFVEKFESETFTQSIARITKFLREKSWPLLRREAHSLKGASSYASAPICQKLCEKLQFAAQEVPVNEAKVNAAYDELMEHALVLQTYMCQSLKRPFSDPEGVFEQRSSPPLKPPAVVVTASSDKEILQMKAVGENTESSLGYTMRRLPPPTGKFISPITRQESEYAEDDAGELDAYDELNKYWRCAVL